LLRILCPRANLFKEYDNINFSNLFPTPLSQRATNGKA